MSGPDLCHCFALKRAARHTARFYDRHLAAAGLKTSQFTLMGMVKRDPGIGIARLAVLMVMERTTLLRALKPLQEAGWVESRRPSHGRAYELILTDAGSAKLEEAEPLWLAAQAAFETSVGASDAAGFRAAVLAMAFSGEG
ncbi:MarR family winged helix-turn-helix transcriptional regulator [Rhizosaccharibacter radicis]|uniref:MarR family winged helix-turn-helix transcriptional regulator n=1 Tax=Rhizosaccharibacter radicis TaxID=2782605 RepID=A0ABT1VWX6_9PROT|nr:MarR family winged helix-turn-helix transcriptional regulator [Acetobacteraceae bacterium KSS12]